MSDTEGSPATEQIEVGDRVHYLCGEDGCEGHMADVLGTDEVGLVFGDGHAPIKDPSYRFVGGIFMLNGDPMDVTRVEKGAASVVAEIYTRARDILSRKGLYDYTAEGIKAILDVPENSKIHDVIGVIASDSINTLNATGMVLEAIGLEATPAQRLLLSSLISRMMIRASRRPSAVLEYRSSGGPVVRTSIPGLGVGTLIGLMSFGTEAKPGDDESSVEPSDAPASDSVPDQPSEGATVVDDPASAEADTDAPIGESAEDE